MQNIQALFRRTSAGSIAMSAMLFAAGCQSGNPSLGHKTAVTPAVQTVGARPAAPAVTTPPAPLPAKGIRIKAGPSDGFTDAEGNVWLPERGFTDGIPVERPDAQIANTKTPVIYQSEIYSMTSFTYPLPNGKYTVKLHFCETYEGITGPGQRVFSFNVEGHEFKDFDLWVKAGGPLRAYIETVPVHVTAGKLDVTFTPQVENPQINGIEIIPEN